MRVMDLSSRRLAPIVEIIMSPAYELVMSLCVFSSAHEHDSFEIGMGWFERARSLAAPDLLDDITRFAAGYGKVWSGLWGLVYEREVPDSAALLQLVEETDSRSLRLHLLNYFRHAKATELPPDLLAQAEAGDEAALQQIIDAACDDEDEDLAGCLRYHLAADPDEDKRQLVGILRRWYDRVFQPQEQELVAALERDAEARSKLKGTLAPERLIERITNGLQYSGELGVRRVALIPSVLGRPWVFIEQYRDTKLLLYAVAEESMTGRTAPSPDHLVKLYKALADERRLEALRKLAERSMTLQQLADDLGVGKSLMHHHMVTLRAAGLVRVSLGHERRYELRTETLEEVPELLNTYLASKAEATAEEKQQ